LCVAERLHRLEAIRDRWDSLREAKACFGRDDFEGAMKTGVVLRKKRWIGGKNGYEVTEYEINTALIESLNSVGTPLSPAGPPQTGTATGAVVPSVPRALRRWRD
jgi:hypothetical protein